MTLQAPFSLKNKRVLVTGACGTVGRHLINQLLMRDDAPDEVVGVDNNESELFFLDQEFLNHPNVHLFLCDIRDGQQISARTRDIDVIFHTAALKHVVMCERSPYEAVHTNILGIQNIIAAASANGVALVVNTSTDKAVNPTNVMGTTKLMGERLITAANDSGSANATVFTSTRFGNVLGSNGSVIPIFVNQIRSGGPVSLTNTEMTRFVMTIEQAARLVIDSASLAKGGEVLITKMPAISIKTLAEVMVDHLAPVFGHNPSDIDIVEIGTKPGEKLYEELMNDEERRRSIELDDYYAVLPAFRGMYPIDYDYPNIRNQELQTSYNSTEQALLTKSELLDFLVSNNLLSVSLADKAQKERYWPGDKLDRSSK